MEGSNSDERCSEMSSAAARVAAGGNGQGQAGNTGRNRQHPCRQPPDDTQGAGPAARQGGEFALRVQASARDQHRQHQRERRDELGEFRQSQARKEPQGIGRIPSEGRRPAGNR